MDMSNATCADQEDKVITDINTQHIFRPRYRGLQNAQLRVQIGGKQSIYSPTTGVVSDRWALLNQHFVLHSQTTPSPV